MTTPKSPPSLMVFFQDYWKSRKTGKSSRRGAGSCVQAAAQHSSAQEGCTGENHVLKDLTLCHHLLDGGIQLSVPLVLSLCLCFWEHLSQLKAVVERKLKNAAMTT